MRPDRDELVRVLHYAKDVQGLTLDQVARRAGYSRRQVARVLAGSGWVSWDCVCDVAQALRVQITPSYEG